MADIKRPSIPPPPHEGGCMCGAVRYSLSSRLLAINACHCTDCKKMSGVEYSVMITALAADFSYTGETVAYDKPADSGRVAKIVRCVKCGVRLWHIPQLGPQYVLFTVGTLDNPSWAIPTSHIWTSRAGAHETFPDDTLVLELGPNDREGMIAAFKRIHG